MMVPDLLGSVQGSTSLFFKSCDGATLLAQYKVRPHYFSNHMMVRDPLSSSKVRPHYFSNHVTVHDPLGSVQGLTSIFFNRDGV